MHAEQQPYGVNDEKGREEHRKYLVVCVFEENNTAAAAHLRQIYMFQSREKKMFLN